jgi:hypothetical protein
VRWSVVGVARSDEAGQETRIKRRDTEGNKTRALQIRHLRSLAMIYYDDDGDVLPLW